MPESQTREPRLFTRSRCRAKESFYATTEMELLRD